MSNEGPNASSSPLSKTPEDSPDVPDLRLPRYPASPMAPSSSSNNMAVGPPSPDDHFLTPRAGSPFFPTSMSSVASAPVSMTRDLSNGSFHSLPGTPPSQSASASAESIPTLRPHQGSDADQHATWASSPGEAEPTTATLAFSTSPSASLASGSSLSSSSATPIANSRQASVESTDEAQLLPWPSTTGDASVDAPIVSAMPDDALQTASPVPSTWSEQLRASLIAEGLSETAVTAEQEIRTLVDGSCSSSSGLVTDAAGSIHEPTSTPQAQDLSSRTQSSSSEISRTPSTSTACSFATSQASAETAPSSVPSESEGVAEEKSGSSSRPIALDSDGQTPVVPDSKGVQSKVRRYHALLELVETERSYAEDLSILIHVYLELLPVQPFFDDHPARVETVVRNTPDLLSIHSDVADFLEQTLEREGIAPSDPGGYLDKATSEGVGAAIAQIGTFFCNLDQRLKAYKVFCARHAETLAVVREAERRHNGEDFAAFERLCSNVLRGRPSSANSSTTEVNRLSRHSSSSVLASAGPSQAAPSMNRSAIWSPLTPMGQEESDAGMVSATSPPQSTAQTNSGASRQTGRLKFADMLIKPVQRLCLYPLVLHTLLKHTGPDDSGKAELEAAMATMKRVADEVDEAGKRREQFLFAELVASRVDPQPPITKPLLSQLGHLKLSGTLDVLYHHVTMAPLVTPLRFRFLGVFLYKNWLLVVKVGKSGAYLPRHWFPLHKAELGSIEEHEGVLPHAFRLTIDRDHHFELAASSSRERGIWVDRLAASIRNAFDSDSQNATSALHPNSLPCSLTQSAAELSVPVLGRSSEVVSRSKSRSENGVDPLGDFLIQQSSASTSPDVLVRYASLAQRAAVDRGMVFSDSVLGARALTQRDGTFTPGGSLTRASPASTQSPTPTGSTSTVNLTSWHAATSPPTSSLSAAVGAAMGLARVAKRSSKQSVTNVFEAAAQQYLVNEELRLAEEGKAAHQSVRQANTTSGGEHSVTGSARSGYSSRRKRPSFAIGGSARPLTTFFNNSQPGYNSSSSQYLLSSDAVESPVPSPTSAGPPGSDSVASGSSSPRSTVPSDVKLKRRQSGSSATVLRDALASAGAWSRRGRSQSTDLDVGRISAMTQIHDDQSSVERVVSPHSIYPSIESADACPPSSAMALPDTYTGSLSRNDKLATTSAPASRPPSLRHAHSAGETPCRERSRTIASPSETKTLTAFPFDCGKSEPPIEAVLPAQSQRRRTASSFGNAMSAPMGSLRRNMSFNRRSWLGMGSKSEASSRRSSVVDSASDLVEGQESQGPYPPNSTLNNSHSDSGRGNFGRSATDTDLLPPVDSAASSRRPSPARSLSALASGKSSASYSTSLSLSQRQQLPAATTAIAAVKAKGSVSTSASGNGGGGFLTRTLSRRFLRSDSSSDSKPTAYVKDKDASVSPTSSPSSRGRGMNLRRFTSHASQTQELPTPLAEESERTSFDFGATGTADADVQNNPKI